VIIVGAVIKLIATGQPEPIRFIQCHRGHLRKSP
jgi:hypothetical protein